MGGGIDGDIDGLIDMVVVLVLKNTLSYFITS